MWIGRKVLVVLGFCWSKESLTLDNWLNFINFGASSLNLQNWINPQCAPLPLSSLYLSREGEPQKRFLKKHCVESGLKIIIILDLDVNLPSS